jgi:prefoldin subunit 5
MVSGQWPPPQAEQAWQGMQTAGFDRITVLKNQAEALQQQLEAIKAQIAEIEKEDL